MKANKKNRKKLFITLALAAAAVMLPLGAGAVSAVFPAMSKSAQKAEQPVNETAEADTETANLPSQYRACRPLSGSNLTPEGLTEILENLEYIPLEYDGQTLNATVMKSESGFPICELNECIDGTSDTCTGQISLDENSDLEEILSEIDESEFCYFLSVYVDISTSYMSEEVSDTPDDVKILTNDVVLTTMHMNVGMFATNHEVTEFFDDHYDVAEVNIDGQVVYLPLIKDENGSIKWKMRKYKIGLEENTLIGEVDPIGSDGGETGWAEALSEISHEYSYALTAEMDYANAYTLNSNGEKVHFDIISG